MIVTVFRSRLMPGIEGEYHPVAQRMDELATTMPGYVSHKGFVAEDGERLTLVAFESEETQRAWRVQPEHLEAQRMARTRFYSAFDITVCQVLHNAKFERDTKA